MYQEYLNQLHSTIAPLGSDDLKELLNDDDKLDTKVDEVLEILKAQKDSLLSENRTNAERNIEKEPQLIELRGKIHDLHEESKEICGSVQDKLQQIKEKAGNVSQDSALALLQAAAAESEETSEALVKKFNDNDMNVDTFLDEFLVARKTMHLRKLKADKMHELMRQQAAEQRNSLIGGGGSLSGPSSGFYPTPGRAANVPYPFGPMMPMPPPRPY